MCSYLLLYNIVLVVFVLITLVKNSDEQQQSAQKRGQGNNTPTTLDSMMKMLQNIEKRIIQIETKQAMFLRGRDGRDGKDGLTGNPGRDGKDGRDGLTGRNGKNGIGQPGIQGPHGMKGIPGQPGPPGPVSGGVQYVRWGKTTCPSGADLVYKGRIGGGRYSHTGAGANYVCLPEIPKYGKYKDGASNHAYMYGAEYEVSPYSPFPKSSINNYEAVCAMCYVKARSSKFMIPATYECPAGWTREYHGYLMSGHHAHKKPGEYICVDEDPEAIPGTPADLDGALLYLVVGICGSLPCHPYVEGRQLTCAVCTK